MNSSEKRHRNKYFKLMLSGALTLIFLPLLMMIFSIQVGPRVHRTTLSSTFEPLTADNWFTGAFQKSLEEYVNDQIGLFSTFIRIHNQLQFSFFNRIYTGDIVAGKENYLFEERYIKAQEGAQFVGLNKIHESSKKLKALQDSLKKMDKLFFVCLAANKPTYYSEYVPYQIKQDSNNREFYVKKFDELQVDYLNMDEWFLEMKDSLGDLLYPKYGIHWSYYGESLATDSIARYIDYKMGWGLPEMKIESLNYSDVEKYYDNDIANSMNLFKMPHHDSLIYPEISWDQPNGRPSKRKMLIIGDSFALIMVEELRLGGGCFEDLNFWYYNVVVREANEKNGQTFGKHLPKLVRHVDFKEALDEFDVIMLMTNEPSMHLFIPGVVKDFQNLLKDSTYRAGMYGDEKLKSTARENTLWREELEAQATKRGVSFDEMLEIYFTDSQYDLDQERELPN